jgi:hypothetical protein
MGRESLEVSEAKGKGARETGEKKKSIGGRKPTVTPGGTIRRFDRHGRRGALEAFRRRVPELIAPPGSRRAGGRRCTHQGGGEQGEEDAEAEDDTVTGRLGEDRDAAEEAEGGGRGLSVRRSAVRGIAE